MKSTITSKLQLTVDVKVDFSFDEFENYVKNEISYKIITEDYLIDALYEYLYTFSEEKMVPEKYKSTYNDVYDYEIDNINELVEHFKYLITAETCCDKAPCGSSYCPTCGTKLK